jgi:hypothetical protein
MYKRFMAPWLCRTLPLSGRQGPCGGEAENLWWPVHSRGLFEVPKGLASHVEGKNSQAIFV